MTGSPFRPHGGQVLLLARELGCPIEAILDFSASLNPLGPPAEALAAAQAAIAGCGHYPESDGASLALALADLRAFRLEAGAMRLSLADPERQTYLLVFNEGVRMVYQPGMQGTKD